MRELITYEAFDGTMFDNYNDCRNYEFKLQASSFKDRVFFFDEKGQPIKVYSHENDNKEDDFSVNIITAYENASYLLFADRSIITKFKNFLFEEATGYKFKADEEVTAGIIYKYNGKNDCWQNFTQMFLASKKIYDKIQEEWRK